MIQETPQIVQFKRQLHDLLVRETTNSFTSVIAKHANVYLCGDQDDMVYFIESGQVKIIMPSLEGKECILAIHSAGDLFGEFCLSGLGVRKETAIAMEETRLKQIPSSKFLMLLGKEQLLEGFVRYLAVRIHDQQQVITNLVTISSELRLGKTLLQLAKTLGIEDPRSIVIKLKISHEELSEMVGTTRPRISIFMQRFRNLGLIEITKEHYLMINEKQLTDYLAKVA
jgi:CRP/FNR family transcriptional regulator, cyclic AMP receptor protein